ncbi:MAG: elongation factor G, partial [Patescibacteria group bacterium]|nr:elongation factor G [Patescibacteria group bacterium]
YLDEEEISDDEVWSVLRKATLSGNFYPITGGDSRKGNVVPKLLDLIIRLLPSPADLDEVECMDVKDNTKKIMRKMVEDELFTALVFKIATDPHIGSLAYVRVYSGKLEAGSYVLNAGKNKKERVSRAVLMHANEREEVGEIRAGDIAALVGLKYSTTGDTLCDEKSSVLLEKIDFPAPVVNVAIEPKTTIDQEKMGIALGRLAAEDPTFTVSSNEETGQTIISGMGELHLEIIVERMKREFSVEADVGQPQVAYRETICKVQEFEGRYVHQSGGRGQYGHCWLRLEPNKAGQGYEFINKIKGGSIPREFIPAIKKGVAEALLTGTVAGYPVVDMKVTLYDGSFHEVDSSEAAFKVAAMRAFRGGMKLADPVLLEPIMSVEVVAPEKYVGDVTGLLSSKRGKIEKTEIRGQLNVVSAKVPLRELFGFTNQLRSMTSGRGTPNVEFSHYDKVPANIEEEVVGDTSTESK